MHNIYKVDQKIKEISITNIKQENNYKILEKKTEHNLQIAERAIKSYGKFLNELDARLTLEEIYNKLQLEE